MPFQSKFDAIPTDVLKQIVNCAHEDGITVAAMRYSEQVGMKPRSLIENLERITGKKRENAREPKKEEDEGGDRALTKEEKKFLEGLRTGSVGLEEASRKVAGIVFEKVLRNPGSVKFSNFFQTELLKIKSQETADRKEYAQELLNRMWSGQLPPRRCPHCGEQWYVSKSLMPEVQAIIGETEDA